MPILKPIIYCKDYCDKNILIVDDDATNLMALEFILLGLNHKVHACSSGEEAVSIFKQRLLN